MMRIFIAAAMIGLLAGCGSRTELQPKPGMTAVPKAAAAVKPAKPSELMTPASQARPDRKADLLTQSEERPSDPFDLPPGSNNGKPGGNSPPASPPAASQQGQ